MHRHCLYAIICALCCSHLTASHPTALHYDVLAVDKRDEISEAQADDVLELEQLRQNHNTKAENGSTAEYNFSPSTSTPESLPELERKLESVAPYIKENVATTTESMEKEQEIKQGVLRPPTISSPGHQDLGKVGELNHAAIAAPTAASPTMIKPFYGAARLAFGQNPPLEVLPTTSTSTTTTTSLPSIVHPETEAPESTASIFYDNDSASNISAANSSVDWDTVLPVTDEVKPHPRGDEEHSSNLNVELDTFKTAARRSPTPIASPQTMAQYVFWTGDELGVAHAVEEFIKQGLMTRESALAFLHDIRLAIENLQRSYQNHGVSDKQLQNIENNLEPIPTTTPITPTTVKSSFHDLYADMLKRRSLLANEFQGPRNDETATDLYQHLLNDASGRTKMSELLYAEYTLEEVLYKLAKAMFTQTLAHRGSDATQKELQKLTSFLEHEGDVGIIPVDLQKKILNVLLAALSDTLTEHRELLPAASLNFASSPFNGISGYAYRPIN